MDSAVIQKRIDMLRKSEDEYRTKREMLADSLANDEELLALEDAAKESRRKAVLQKQALMNEPENKKLVADMKDLAVEIRDTKKLLGDELVAYFMENRSLEYVDPSGSKRRFRVSAAFVKGKEEE